MNGDRAEDLTVIPEAMQAIEKIEEAMEEANVSRAELARMLGTSRANVTALLSGRRNMTLRTLADLASALGQRVEISLSPLPGERRRRNLEVPREQVAEFCRRNNIRRLALFGSVLRDDFRPDSDVDVLVEFEPGQRLGFAFFGIQDELSDLLGRKVDLNTPQDLSRYFRDEVVKNAEVIFDTEAPPHAA